MSVAELKEKIISRVAELEEEGVLAECWNLLNHDSGLIMDLNEDDIMELKKREADIDRGEYYTHEEFVAIMKDRLERYNNG